MSTNFDLHRQRPCPECGQQATTLLHIGKRSVGWVFCWQGLPAEQSPSGTELKDAESWREFLAREIKNGAEIQSEVGTRMSLDEFFAEIQELRGRRHQSVEYGGPIRAAGRDDVLYGTWH